MPSVRVRVTAGVSAWIAGAAAATGLSLFAVSYLNQDPNSPQGATLSQTQVEQALASISSAAGLAAPPTAATRPGPAATPPQQSAPASPTGPAPSQSTTSAAPARNPAAASPVQRTLSGDAGSVVAQCQGSAVYLVTWSPAQGYQAELLQRGPAHLATLVFTGFGHHVAIRVGCSGGAPALVQDDDGDR